jgi:hypothetical protein
VLVAAQQPVFVWGGPGIGKSAVVKQLAEALKITLQDVRALLLDPVDLRGLPFLGNDGRSKWATPEFLPQEGSGILFLDELNAAPAMVQASCYQLVLDRKLGEYTLPEGWAIIAAGNRDSDRGATTRMPTPLRNRFVHLDFEVDVHDWSDWAIHVGIRPEVIAFLRFRPELLSAFDRDTNAFPSHVPGSLSPASSALAIRSRTQRLNTKSLREPWVRAPPRNSLASFGCSGNCHTSTLFC